MELSLGPPMIKQSFPFHFPILWVRDPCFNSTHQKNMIPSVDQVPRLAALCERQIKVRLVRYRFWPMKSSCSVG